MNHLLYQLLHAYLLKLCTKELEQGFSHPIGCYAWNLGIFLFLVETIHEKSLNNNYTPVQHILVIYSETTVL